MGVQDCRIPSKPVPGIYDLGGRTKKLDAKKRQSTMMPEIYFAGWRHNLYVRERSQLDDEISEKRQRKQMQPKMMPEKIFNEWLHNFHFHNRRFSKSGSLRRRSSKKEKTPNKEDAYEGSEINIDEALDDKSLKNKSRSNRQRRSKNKKR